MRSYKSVDQIFWQNSNFRGILPYCPACLNFYTAIKAGKAAWQKRGKIRILPKMLVHTFVRPHRSASDSTLSGSSKQPAKNSKLLVRTNHFFKVAIANYMLSENAHLMCGTILHRKVTPQGNVGH